MPSEDECMTALREARWPRGVTCPLCGSDAVVKHDRHLEVYQRYHCKQCGRHFNDRTGTLFEYSKLPLRVWFFAAFQMQYKVSVSELAKTLGVHYETAFNIVKRLREGLHLNQLTGQFKGIVEMDEVYITAGLKGKRGLHRSPRGRGLKRRGRGTYDGDKPPVMGMVVIGGAVWLTPSRDVAGGGRFSAGR